MAIATSTEEKSVVSVLEEIMKALEPAFSDKGNLTIEPESKDRIKLGFPYYHSAIITYNYDQRFLGISIEKNKKKLIVAVHQAPGFLDNKHYLDVFCAHEGSEEVVHKYFEMYKDQERWRVFYSKSYR